MAKKTAAEIGKCDIFGEWLAKQPVGRRSKLRRAKDHLLALFQEPKKGDIRWQAKVGTCLLRFLPPGGKRQDIGVIPMLADLVLPGRNPAEKSILTSLFLWQSMAKRCTPAEIRDYAAKVRAGTVTSQHVAYLVSVIRKANKTTRAQFLRKCISEGWSANRLRREIQNDRLQLVSFGGRHYQPRATSSPSLAAWEIVTRARAWMACYERYFQSHSAPLARMPRTCSPRLRRELLRALECLKDVAKSARTAHRTLRAIVSRLPPE
jgi:hypothetical protein